MKYKYKKGERIGFHGREGIVKQASKGYVDVYFKDTGETESIDEEELYEQDFDVDRETKEWD